MKILALLLIFIGFICLALSLRPAQKILTKTQNRGWKLLRLLIGGFLLAYLGSFAHILLAPEFSSAFLAHGVLLAGGGTFVFFVIRYSLDSILKHEYHVSYDGVTNLRNRHSFISTAKSLTTEPLPFYILLIDISGFKQFNEAFGHTFGDALLKVVANKIARIIPESCEVFRVSGDKFGIIGRGNRALSLESDISEIQKTFDQPIEVEQQNLRIGTSIGVSLYPQHSADANELIHQAERALYVSKKHQGHWKIYPNEFEKNVLEHLEIAQGLQLAIDNNEFSLRYQPLIDCSDNSLHGAEVLIRWQQKNGDFISPDKFIPIAEQSTLINDITCWVVHKVIEDMAELNRHGFDGGLHINLSAKDLHSEQIVTCLNQMSSEASLEPGRIVFEVTESAMMSDVKHATRVMESLSELGFSFSLDDFGTGFSSFPLLRELPLTQIKIDRSFVMGMLSNHSNQSIVNSMIYLAKSLRCSVIAEGVEDSATAQILKSSACDYLQGYHFSKPLTLEEFLVWSSRHQ